MKNRFRNFLLAFVTVISFTAKAQHYCIAGRFSETPLFDNSQIISDTGVIYADPFNPFTGQRENLKMDLFYPDMNLDSMSKRPVVICMHGGGFSVGERASNTFFSYEFAKRGYVAVSIDYRLGWGCNGFNYCSDCPGDSLSLRQAVYMAVQDLRAAQRYLTGNAVGLNINPNVFFLQGTSAGAMACFFSVLNSQAEAEAFAPGATALLGLLDTAGNAFRNNSTIRGISSFSGAIPGDTGILSRIKIPVISFHDENDCVVPYESGTIFGCECSSFFSCTGPKQIYDYQTAHNLPAELHTIAASNGHCTYPDADVLLGSICFFKNALCYSNESGTYEGSPVLVTCDLLETAFQIGTDDLKLETFPYPADESIKISFSDYSKNGGTVRFQNILGNQLFEASFPPLTENLVLDLRAVPSGIYFLVFDSPAGIPPQKILVVHPQ